MHLYLRPKALCEFCSTINCFWVTVRGTCTFLCQVPLTWPWHFQGQKYSCASPVPKLCFPLQSATFQLLVNFEKSVLDWPQNNAEMPKVNTPLLTHCQTPNFHLFFSAMSGTNLGTTALLHDPKMIFSYLRSNVPIPHTLPRPKFSSFSP